MRYSLTLNDVDLMLHRFMTSVDRCGTRDVQHLMHLEIKTRGAMPNPHQRQTLFFLHQLLENKKRLLDSLTGGRRSVWHFGVSVLSMHGVSPEDGPPMHWCRFRDDGEFLCADVDVRTLRMLLRFEIDADTRDPLDQRRHHLTRELVVPETTPLGFVTERKVVRRS